MPHYYPQMTLGDVPIKKGGNKQSRAIPIAMTETSENFGKTDKVYDNKFPSSQISFSVRDGRGLHPTQKPVALIEYLIKTYTNEGETVLDNCPGYRDWETATGTTNRTSTRSAAADRY